MVLIHHKVNQQVYKSLTGIEIIISKDKITRT